MDRAKMGRVLWSGIGRVSQADDYVTSSSCKAMERRQRNGEDSGTGSLMQSPMPERKPRPAKESEKSLEGILWSP